MTDDKEISFYDIDQSLSGESLTSDLIHSFESAFLVFKDSFDPDSKESKEKLDDMVRLLSISDKNLEEVKNQKWFQRVWRTISGKNKKLEQINKQNLYRVQEGSIYFLQKLAQQNQLMMQSVYFALKRIEDIQIQNEKLKGYLFRIVNGYNERIRNIEGRLDEHEQEIAELKGKTRMRWGVFLVGLFLLGGAVTLFYFFDRNWMILSGSGAILLLGILVFMKSFSKSTSKRVEVYGSPRINKIRIENDKLKPTLRENLSQAICNAAIIFKLVYYPVVAPFFEKYQELLDVLLKPLNTDGKISNDKIAMVMDSVFRISCDVIQLIKANCSNVAAEYIRFINSFISEIIKEYLPNSIGIDLQSHLDYSVQVNLGNQILATIEPYFENLSEIENRRYSLLQDYPRYRKILTENPFMTFTKGFLEELFIPWIIDDRKEFIDTFSSNFKEYISLWNNFADVSMKSILPFLQNLSCSFAKDAVNNMDFLFDEFSNNEIELKSLNNKVIQILVEQKKNFESIES
ncbi:MAG: hypothetical protein ACP5L3_07240 [Caldisericum sp.]|uniref:hypothetical protein n=1 Tax=Caldisericum sp. TaxID=2499687 RepID=UPI003D0DA3BC